MKFDKATLATLEHEYLKLRGSFLRNVSNVISTHCKVLKGEFWADSQTLGPIPIPILFPVLSTALW